mmetsp:Transcript_18545/g.28192  ORF Transcript_18545/g.28192 Transcript_18545/m.28192 type:complete len:83 (+) Transcript_18545:779-1027(+)
MELLMQREVGSLDVSWISWAVADDDDVVTMKMHAAPVSKMSFMLFVVCYVMIMGTMCDERSRRPLLRLTALLHLLVQSDYWS